MRSALIAAVFLLAACDSAPPPGGAAAPLSATEARLVDYAASDFKTHVDPSAAEFRRVYAGVIEGESQTRNVLCGEFRAPAYAQWAPFLTIETDPYENWLGGAGAGQCAAPETTLGTRDLADVLAQRYRASD